MVYLYFYNSYGFSCFLFRKWYNREYEYNYEKGVCLMFMLLAGGLLIILLAVVIAVVSSVVSAVAAATDDAED